MRGFEHWGARVEAVAEIAMAYGAEGIKEAPPDVCPAGWVPVGAGGIWGCRNVVELQVEAADEEKR